MSLESYTLGGEIFQGGKWIDIIYGRPLLRGREAFPGGEDYGKVTYAGAPAKDVTRATMKVETLPYRTEQLSWEFLDVTDDGGRMAVVWDKNMASVPYQVAH